MSLLLKGVTEKRRVYRGYLIKITREGTWVEANLYRPTGQLDEHIGSGTYGPGVYARLFDRGERIVDAMKGD